MGDAPLHVERRDRLGAGDLTHRRMDGDDGQRRLDRLQGLGDQRAAIVDLDNDAVGAEQVGRDHHRAGPAMRASALDRPVGDDITAPVRPQPDDDDAAGVGLGAAAHGRVDPDHRAPGRRRSTRPAAFEQVARPQRAIEIVDELAEQFLPRKPRPVMRLAHRREEGRREVDLVVHRPAARHDDARSRGRQRLQPFQRARRRRQHLPRLPSRPQRQAKIGQRRFGRIPFGDLVAPRKIEVGPAQRIRLGRPEQRRDRAVGPGQAAQRRLELRRYQGDAHDPGLAFDHDAARLAKRRADQGDLRPRHRPRPLVDPRRAGEGFAEAAASQDQPRRPVTRRR